jgi:transposase
MDPIAIFLGYPACSKTEQMLDKKKSKKNRDKRIKHDYTDEQIIAAIEDAIKNKLSTVEASKKMGVPKSTFYHWCMKHKGKSLKELCGGKPYTLLTEEQKKDFIVFALKNSGKEAAKKYGVSYTMVERLFLAKFGEKYRKVRKEIGHLSEYEIMEQIG